ncbi:LysR family transcriptional regulator [Tuanshanicoccus lijuaniae]|uniref:LysR family transcriptional regulator n=1 Tax=Aerococcaceae bacterium zg-1292 TaxID=2774330 RepID=UPI00193549B2|nr:LysR family transcriptional regulator [Aerococcaceae bacterium zg-1292]QQA37048.1 LysR family transcriptional regulator [Aerococcaceae bacterium zg-1292]
MNFEQLLHVEVLSQYRSMQAAAEVLHITKPGLSLSIQQLEEELNVKLFNRSSKGTMITPEGRQLLAAMSEILKAKNHLENLAKVISNPKNIKPIVIQYMNTMLRPFMDVFIQQYQTQKERISLDISCHELDTIVENVTNQTIDAGFIAVNSYDEELLKNMTFTPVIDSKLVILCSLDNPLVHLNRKITIADLKTQKFCLFNDKLHDAIFERLQFQCGPLVRVLRVDDAWAMEEAINQLNTICFARVVQSQLSNDDKIKNLQTIDIGHILNDNFKMGWLTNANKTLSDETRRLLNEISRAIEAEMRNIE